ncbi:MAG: homocysteine S-methyltransferase family protein [bacterium]
MAELRRLLTEHELVLTEGAVIERLRRSSSVQLDAYVANATLVGDRKGRLVMGRIYREYLDIGQATGMPMLLLTPTWRASAERVERAGIGLDVNQAAFEMLAGIRRHYGEYGELVAIGGLVGPKSDAYRPTSALPPDAAQEYHRPQVEELVVAGVDFILGATLPAVSEAIGIAEAVADFGMPYLLSFVLRPDGAVLDATLLASAIRKVDEAARHRPLGYLVNCVHPDTFRLAGEQLQGVPEARARLLGLQANASRKSAEVLDGSDATDAGDPAEFGRQMAALWDEFGLRVLGGCCGTDGRHIRAIAEALVPGEPGWNRTPGAGGA